MFGLAVFVFSTHGHLSLLAKLSIFFSVRRGQFKERFYLCQLSNSVFIFGHDLAVFFFAM
jgi:hypothetical protein